MILPFPSFVYPRIVFALLLSSTVFADNTWELQKTGKPTTVQFDVSLPLPSKAGVLQPGSRVSRETMEVFVPTNYSGKEPFGLFVFIDSLDKMSFPSEWISLLENNKLVCAIPQQVGNDQPLVRRFEVPLGSIRKLQSVSRINPRRVFTAGFSGGARCSLRLALLHSELITGNISICGADFYEVVPQVKAVDTRGYGVFPVPAECIPQAKTKTRFAFITGEKDFRHGNILDIYNGGFVKNQFQAKLIDVPGLGHQLCEPKVLQAAIDFVSEPLK
jgi:predicted esterase